MPAEDRAPELASVTAVFLGLSAVTVALRCYVRQCLLGAFQMEDWLALGTLLCFIVYSTFVMLSIGNGAGKHLDAVPAENIPEALKMRWAGELAYVVTSLFLKFTIGIFLLRICSQAWQRFTIRAVLVVCLVFNLFYTCIAAFQCQPVHYFWTKYTGTTTGQCLDEDMITGSTYAAAAINACADWILGLLPIAIVWNLDLKTRSKISVAAILALGSIASSATIVRIPYVWQLAHDTDVLYEFTDLAVWSTVENGLGLTASSIATLRPLLRHFFDSPQSGPSPSESSSPSPSARPSWQQKQGSVVIHCRGLSDESQYYKMEGYPESPGSAKRYRESV